MPELPEVETIVRELRSQIIGKSVLDILEIRKGTVRYLPAATDIPCHFGMIRSIDRRGKYLVFRLVTDITIIIHLGMSGKLILADSKDTRPTHLRAQLALSDDSFLYFDDIRTFGHITVQRSQGPLFFEQRMGIEPLDPGFTAEYLQDRLRRRKSPLKNLLLDQSIVAGIGNIYGCEALYRAKIHPAVRAGSLESSHLKKLVKEIRAVLNEAIGHNGTTISNYRRVDNKTGGFQNFLKVYQKSCCPKGHPIDKLTQAGRSTYFCPVCQKKKQTDQIKTRPRIQTR
ncbi:DNA-formamidopyrimidine glycosylase [Candidatus Wirthbacteria bacterium CG2_30_54_11]|uniref:DNA-formamidopyrimidine glycosylase n=1 Tax=Candidatus Wirthbacteria bacterium CG2_30_54_11 TaxID=1817892 RepID=A0A1J5IX75_9BACT|nr:MAG: DNA-formamidopyrimidine glycosylase [Candidatus Wirthbacteria bacterium CG2_30_54_11]